MTRSRSKIFTLRRLLRTVFAVLAIFVSGNSHAQSPWVQEFTPARTLYVSPLGGGQGTSVSDPMSLGDAISNAAPGDLIWMTEGTYTGALSLTTNGSAALPIVYRAFPGHRVVVNGGFEITGDHTWIWGLEITDPNRLSFADSGVRMLAPGIHVINNVVYNHRFKVGIGAWNKGPGQVIYGNIVYDNSQDLSFGHNIYAQNNFSQYGFKYFVQNMFLDSEDVCSSCFNFHGYTQGGFVTGFYVQENIVSNGHFLISDVGNVPADRSVIIRNYFYDSFTRLGGRRPTQVEFMDNVLFKSFLNIFWFWGDGEVLYTQTAPNVVTGNEFFIRPASRPFIAFRTVAYVDDGAGGFVRKEGVPAIQATDTFDNNTYYDSRKFTATFFANNNNLGDVNFATWKSATAAAGNAFDANSTHTGDPTGSRVVLLPNEYEEGRAHLAIFNWDLAPDVTVDLSSVVPEGTLFDVYPAKDVFGTAVVSGTYSAPINVPTGGEEFTVYLVIAHTLSSPKGLRVVSP